jgi:hypothetical protein
MCDSVGSVKGPKTQIDVNNAFRYASMKILYDRVKNYQNLSWVPTNQDNSATYYCPSGLKNPCLDGSVRINSKKECDRLSNFDQYRGDNANPDPSPNNGFYLEWRPDSLDKIDGEGNCYLGSPYFRKQCEEGKFDPNDKTSKGNPNTLRYDENTGRCFITQKYCNSVGKLGYDPSSSNAYIPAYIRKDNDGGSCDLTGGQKALDFIFGSTISQGIIGGKCFK